MGSRAECVMLNKGPYILETLDFLRDVLARMESHQDKKTLDAAQAQHLRRQPSARAARGDAS